MPIEYVLWGLSGLLAILLGVLGWRVWQRRRVTPVELERRRRMMLNARGKLGDAELVDVEGHNVVYSYAVRGVGYTAAQDVSAIAHLLPETVTGPMSVKFDPKNPANSIVVCEDWNGCSPPLGRGPMA